MTQVSNSPNHAEFTNDVAGIGPEHIRHIVGALELLKAFTPTKQPRQPRIIPEGIYSLSDLVENLEMSENTIRTWYTRRDKENRIKVLQPASRRLFFRGADVLAYIEANGDADT